MERATLGHKQVVESYIAVLDQEQERPQTATSLTYQLTINTKWNKQHFKLDLSGIRRIILGSVAQEMYRV